jgi:ketosteroid isomerase-like protein
MYDKFNQGRLQDTVSIANEWAVRNLSHAFSDAVNRRDFELFRSIWTEDAIWVIEEPFAVRAIGREAIVQSAQKALEGWEFFFQQLHSGIVQIDRNRAISNWSVQETGRYADGSRMYNNFGLYEDELEKRDNVWGFTKRTYRYVWFDSQSEILGQVVTPTNLLLGAATDGRADRDRQLAGSHRAGGE